MSGKVNALHGRIVAEIDGGALPVGGKLPSRQQLVRKYGFSRSTVDRALARLVAEGRIEGRRGSGSYVLPPPPAGPIRKLCIVTLPMHSSYEVWTRDRLAREAEIRVPCRIFDEDDLLLRLDELTAPGTAVIWDQVSLYTLPFMRHVARAGNPQLLLNRRYRDYDFVASDQKAALHEALAWLMIEGGRDIAMLSAAATPEEPYLYDRIQAFYESAAELGARFTPDSILCRSFSDIPGEIAEFGRQLFVTVRETRAITVLSWALALPLITCGLAYGKRPGRDYRLVCFDRIPELPAAAGVCLIRQRYELIIMEAMRWLSQYAGTGKPFRRTVKPELIVAAGEG